jgi:hypothetical protein
MESFIPSWMVLDKRKVVWGLAAIGYCAWQLAVGNPGPFQLFLKVAGGVIFVLFLTAGKTLALEKIFNDKAKARKWYQYLVLGSVIVYVWLLSRM